MTSPDKRLAKDIARNLDSRRRRRRLLVLALLVVAILLAILYLRCGKGLGGKSAGTGDDSVAPARPVAIDAGPSRCTVRLTAAGLTLEGTPAERADVVAACKRTTGAEVVVTGDARQGDWDELRTALEAEGIEIFTKQH